MDTKNLNLTPLTLEEEMTDGGGYASSLIQGAATGVIYGAAAGGIPGAIVGFNAGIVWGSAAYVTKSLIAGKWS